LNGYGGKKTDVKDGFQVPDLDTGWNILNAIPWSPEIRDREVSTNPVALTLPEQLA
jgi:hypothetical protein